MTNPPYKHTIRHGGTGSGQNKQRTATRPLQTATHNEHPIDSPNSTNRVSVLKTDYRFNIQMPSGIDAENLPNGLLLYSVGQ